MQRYSAFECTVFVYSNAVKVPARRSNGIEVTARRSNAIEVTAVGFHIVKFRIAVRFYYKSLFPRFVVCALD